MPGTPNAYAIFNAAVEIDSSLERDAYVERACRNDVELMRQVQRLLRAYFQEGDTLEHPILGAPIIAEPGDTIGPYKLLQKIGEGGCGCVFMAEQKEPIKRKIALKIIKLGMDTKEVVARFEAERQALAMMDHPNIAKVFDGGSTKSGRPYFVMELVKGVSITEFCDKNRYDTRERLRLFVAVCEAVQHAHHKGVIHRDLKPSNILVTLYDGRPVPKVIDFGIAKSIGQSLTERTLFTEFGRAVGTPLYMSPEQAEMSAIDVDTRSDIYSLGTLLYELITGVTPFDDDELRKAGIEEMRRIIREDEPPTPSARLGTLGNELTAMANYRSTDTKSLAGTIRGDLDWIVMKALDKDRERRYKTADAMAEDVCHFLTDDPVEARPPTLAYRLRKAFRKHRAAMLTCGIMFLSLLMGIAGTTWQAIRASAQAERARVAEADAEAEAERARIAEVDAKAEAERAGTSETRIRALSIRSEVSLYARKLQLAQLYWQFENPAAGQDMLESCQWKYRAWEHRYLQTKFNSQSSFSLLGHGFSLTGAFSPDGQQIVSGNEDGTLTVWDANSGEAIRTFEGRHSGLVNSVGFSPDGERVVSGSADSTAKLWDVRTGVLLHTFEGHSSSVQSVAFSPDGTRIVSGIDGIKVWDAKSGKVMLEVNWLAYSVAFSPDGERIVGGGVADDTLKLWDAKTGDMLRKFEGHSGPVNSVAFSPSGRWIISGSDDHTLKLWDAQAGTLLRTLVGHLNSVNSVAFSPDGERIVSGSDDESIKLWDARDGRQLKNLNGHNDVVTSVAFDCTGSRVVSGTWCGPLKVWNVISGEVKEILQGHSDVVNSVAFSPDKRRIISGSADNTVKLWDAQAGTLVRTFEGHTDIVNSVEFDSHGKLIVSGSDDNTVKLWNATTGTLARTFEGHSSSVNSVAFSPDVHWIISGSDDATVKVWNVETGTMVRTFEGHSVSVNSVAFSPDGAVVVSASDPGQGLEEVLEAALSGRSLPISSRFIVWEATTGKLMLNLGRGDSPRQTTRRGMNGYAGTLRDGRVAFSPNGNRIVGCSNGTTQIWDATSGQPMLSLEGTHGVAFSPDGERIVACRGRSTMIWDARSGEELLTLEELSDVNCIAVSSDRIVSGGTNNTLKLWDASGGRVWTTPPNGQVRAVAYSPDCERIAVLDSVSFRVLDTRTGRFVQSFVQSFGSEGSCAAFCPDGERIAIGSNDNTVQLRDANSGILTRAFEGHSGPVNSVAFSPSGERIVSGSRDNTLRLWNSTSGALVQTFEGHSSSVNSVAFSPDGQRIISGSGDATAKLWSASTGALVRTFEGHSSSVNSVAFSPDGDRILTGSDDHTLKRWDANTGVVLHTFEGHSNSVRSVAFGPDGDRIVSGSNDSTVKLWSARSGEVMQTMKEHYNVVNAVAFSPDGEWIASGSNDYTLKVWNLEGL